MFQKQKLGGKKIPAPTSGPSCRWYYYIGVQWHEWGDGMGDGVAGWDMHRRYRVQWWGKGYGSIRCKNNYYCLILFQIHCVFLVIARRNI